MPEGVVAPAQPGRVRRWLETQGRVALLAWAILRALPRPRRYLNATIRQAYQMGVHSLPLVRAMGALGGADVAMQAVTPFTGSVTLWAVGTDLVAGLLTEVGPALTASTVMAR